MREKGPPKASTGVVGAEATSSNDAVGAQSDQVLEGVPTSTPAELKQRHTAAKRMLKNFERDPILAEGLGQSRERLQQLVKDIQAQRDAMHPPEVRLQHYDQEIKLQKQN